MEGSAKRGAERSPSVLDPSTTTTTTPSPHADVILDLSFDYYGQLLATAGADHSIAIFEQSGGAASSGRVQSPLGDPTRRRGGDHHPHHHLLSFTRIHEAPITKVAWSHPVYGSLLASASQDKTIRISSLSSHPISPKVRAGNNSRGKLNVLGKIYCSPCPVQDLCWINSNMGLGLVGIDTMGTIWMYEALDPTNPSAWTCTMEIPPPGPSPQQSLGSHSSHSSSTTASRKKSGKHAISLSDGNTTPLMAASGMDGAWLYAFRESGWRLQLNITSERTLAISIAPTMGRSFVLIALATQECVFIYKCTPSQNSQPIYDCTNISIVATFDDVGVDRLAWNLTGTVLTTCRRDTVKMYRQVFLGDWKLVASCGLD